MISEWKIDINLRLCLVWASVIFVEALYSTLSVISEQFYFFSSLLLGWMLYDWTKKDALTRKYVVPYDLGFVILVAWFVILPAYLWKTRGFRKTLCIICFFFLFTAGVWLSAMYTANAFSHQIAGSYQKTAKTSISTNCSFVFYHLE